MRIRPKISEKPDASRNNRPPKVMLLTVSSNQKVISTVFPLVVRSARGRHFSSTPAGSFVQISIW